MKHGVFVFRVRAGNLIPFSKGNGSIEAFDCSMHVLQSSVPPFRSRKGTAPLKPNELLGVVDVNRVIPFSKRNGSIEARSSTPCLRVVGVVDGDSIAPRSASMCLTDNLFRCCHGFMLPYPIPIAVRSGLVAKTCAIAVGLGLAAIGPGCGSAPEAYVPSPPSQSIHMDGTTYAWIGRQALAQYGYEEIINRGVQAGFLRYPDSEQTNTQNFVGQTMADAASQAWPVFTQGAVMALLTSQLDSPAPGPADAIALGMLVVAIANAGSVAAMVLTSSPTATATPVPTVTAVPTATVTTTTTSPPIAVPRRCLPCLPVPAGGHGYEYHSVAAGHVPHYGMANHTHHFRMNQSPPAKGCRCGWQRDFTPPTPEFSPLPGAVPVTPHGGGGIAP